MKITRPILLLICLFLFSCHTIINYKPGYERISFDKWSSEKFSKIGVELQLPEKFNKFSYRNDFLKLFLHTYYPESALVEYTPTYYICIYKFSEEQYKNPKYFQKNIHAPYFYKDTEYQINEVISGRLGTEVAHFLIKHFKDSMGNIYVIEIKIYPWPNKTGYLEEDINAAYKIINSFKIIE